MTDNTFVETMLVISTGHVTENTARLLDERKCPGVISFNKGDYGWLVFVPAPDGSRSLISPPSDVDALITFAMAKGCGWLMLDCDAEAHPNLPTYEW